MEQQFKVGDIVLFYTKQKRLFRKSKLVFDTFGILINVYGVLYIAIPGEDIFPWILEEYLMNNIKILSPKKPYTKDEQEKLSRHIVHSPIVLDAIGSLDTLVSWANYVRPNTFDGTPGPAQLSEIESNRYYRVVKEQ